MVWMNASPQHSQVQIPKHVESPLPEHPGRLHPQLHPHPHPHPRGRVGTIRRNDVKPHSRRHNSQSWNSPAEWSGMLAALRIAGAGAGAIGMLKYVSSPSPSP